MSTLSASVVINSPVSKVFEYVVTPENWTRYVTSLVDVRDLSPDAPAVGSTFIWEYKMMGLRFSGRGRVSSNDKDRAFGLALEGKHPVTESYEFKDLGDGASELKIEISYEVPGILAGAIAKTGLVEKLNKVEAANVLEKIKTFCEAG